MADNLPDEIIREILILSPALHVPDELFADTSEQSPFCLLPISSSILLEVCKSWLRVATPLLYRVVVLRSGAQAQALDRALRANKQFGLFIRKLRIEGGYGAALRTILRSAPNVTDLWIPVSLRSNESVTGLRSSLDAINPVRVILFDANTKDNVPMRKLVEKLAECFRVIWSRLVFHTR